MAVATEKMGGFRERAHLRRLERNGPLARSVTRRAYVQFAEEGGEDGTGMKFLDWLIANWDSILKMIMSVIGLFGGVPAFAPKSPKRKGK